jgi:hypothetical protein
MTTIEHAIPVPTLYDDVLTLYALSGTGSTPTHIVNYGGTWGEQLVWASESLPNDPKLRKFTRHDILEALSESTARPKNCKHSHIQRAIVQPHDRSQRMRFSTPRPPLLRWSEKACVQTSVRMVNHLSG